MILNENVKISIVTPSFNQGEFIEDAILSVLNQGYDNIDHIIIDGGSKDNTVEILKKYPHLTWISEADEGQSDAINKGFKLAKGEIIGWLNADDIYLPNTFKSVQKVFNEDKIVDAIYSNYKFIDSEGNITKELITQKPKKWMSLFYCFIPSTTFFFRRRIIESGILIDKDFHITMDKEFFARIFYAGFTIKKVENYFAHFRWHDNNKSIDTLEVKKIRNKEGIKIFNRYSNYKLSYNLFGNTIYTSLRFYCKIYRGLNKFFFTGIYGK